MPFGEAFDAAAELVALRDENQLQARLRGFRRHITPEQAVNAANYARTYPAATADAVAAVGMSEYDYDLPELRKIAELDAKASRGPLDMAWDAIKWSSRNTFAVADSIYDSMPHTQGLRMATRLAQGEGLGDAYRGSEGRNYLAQIAAAETADTPWTMGEGFNPQAQRPEDSTEYAEAFTADLDRQLTQGAAPEQANLDAAHEVGLSAMPFDIAAAAEAQAASTRLNVGDQSVPVSLGGLLAYRIVAPDTLPYNVLSSLVDLPARVGLDPLNVAALELTNVQSARRLLIPDPDDYAQTRAVAGKQWAERDTVLDGTAYRQEDADLARLIDERGAEGADPEIINRLAGVRTQLPRQHEQTRRVMERIQKLARSENEGAEMWADWQLAQSRNTRTLTATDREFTETVAKTGVEDRAGQARRQLKAYGRGGLNVSWRPWVQPTFVSDFLDSGRGVRITNYLAETGSYDEMLRLLGPDLDVADMKAIHDTADPAVVREVLARNLGTGDLRQAPRLGPVKAARGARSRRVEALTGKEHLELDDLNQRAATYDGLTPDEAARRDVLAMHEREGLERVGAATDLDPARGAAGGRTVFDDETALGRLWRRYFRSEGGAAPVAIDPTNPNESIGSLRNWLNTAGADPAEIDDVVGMVVNNPNEWAGVHVAAERAKTILARKLGEPGFLKAGYSADDVSTIMDAWLDPQHKHKLYGETFTGEPVGSFYDEPLRIVNSQGEATEIRVPHPVVESQFAERNFILPSVRDVRMATSRYRALTDKLRNTPRGLNKTWARSIADGVLTGWRTMALARFGWPARVLVDETARAMAAGYGETFASPMSYLAHIWSGKGAVGGDTKAMADLFKESGGLGLEGLRTVWSSGGYASPINHTAAAWTTARYGHPAYKHGLTTRLMHFRSSLLSRTVAAHGIDDSVDILRAQHADELTEIASKATPGSALARVEDPQVLRNVLERAEFMHARYSGGAGYWRQTPDSQWVDMASNPVSDPDVLAKLPADRQFVVTDHGSPAVRQFLTDGTIPGAPVKRSAKHTLRWRLQQGQVEGHTFVLAEGDQALAIERNGIVTGDARVSRFLNQDLYTAADAMTDPVVLVYRNSDLGTDWKHLPSDLPAPTGGARPIQSYTAKELRTPVEERPVLGAGLDDDPIEVAKNIERNVEFLYRGGYAQPETVAVPVQSGRQADTWGQQAVNTLFGGLSKPSQVVVRSPFANTVFWDEMAYHFVHGDDATRTLIRNQATDAGMSRDLNAMAKRWMDRSGIKSLPEGGQGWNWDDLQDVAAARATAETRDLFYDLTKVSNAADATRLIYPFADAFWEVLSRWGRLMNPYKVGGQALRNVRRPQQALHEARQSGWFSENEYGDEVFNWPLEPGRFVGGLVGDGWRVTPEMSVESLLFVDPSNPREVLMPGTGPLVQIPAAGLLPRLPAAVREQAQWLVYGDFAPPSVTSVGGITKAFLPTVYKRVFQAALADEYRQEYAGTAMEIYSAMAASGDPRYPVETHAEAKGTMEAARSAASTISFLRIFDGFFLPGQPRRQAQVQVTDDFLAGDIDEYLVVTAGLANEQRAAEDLLGDRQAATQHVLRKYGIDPLYHVSGTVEVKARPFTRPGFKYLEQNPALGDHADLTLMAFVPEDPDGDFYSRAWQHQLSTGARQRVEGADHAASLINQRLGQAAYDEMQRTYDKLTGEAEQLYGRDSATFSTYRKELEAWRKQRIDDIHMEHWAWGNDKTLVGRPERPRFGNLLTEIDTIGDPSTEAHRKLKELNPEMVGYFTHVSEMWRRAEERSLQMGNSRDWWRLSDPEVVDPSVVPYQEQLRTWFTQGLQWYTTQRMEDPTNRQGAQWITDRVVHGVVAGYGDDDEILLDVTQPPAASIPRPEAGGRNMQDTRQKAPELVGAGS